MELFQASLDKVALVCETWIEDHTHIAVPSLVCHL